MHTTLIRWYCETFAQTVTASTYGVLKGALCDEFGQKHTLLEVYEQLKNRKRKPNESVQRYFVEMRVIANKANIPERDLVDAIISGLNERSSLVSMLYQATTVEQLKKQYERYDKLRDKSTLTTVRPQTTTHKVLVKSDSTDVVIRCFNCSQMGHYQSSCTKPLRKPGSCFKCGELGHFHQTCPKKKTAVAAINTNVELKDAGMADAVDEMQEVSVTVLGKQSKRTVQLILSLLDSGSPRSFIKRSVVPFKMSSELKPTKYRGVGNKQLFSYGAVLCKINLKGQEISHRFLVLDDSDLSMPVLIGRDLLNKFRIFLCKFRSKIQYSKKC